MLNGKTARLYNYFDYLNLFIFIRFTFILMYLFFFLKDYSIYDYKQSLDTYFLKNYFILNPVYLRIIAEI